MMKDPGGKKKKRSIPQKARAVAIRALEEARKIKKYEADGYHTTPEYDALFDSPAKRKARREAGKSNSKGKGY